MLEHFERGVPNRAVVLVLWNVQPHEVGVRCQLGGRRRIHRPPAGNEEPRRRQALDLRVTGCMLLLICVDIRSEV